MPILLGLKGVNRDHIFYNLYRQSEPQIGSLMNTVTVEVEKLMAESLYHDCMILLY